MWVKDKLSPTKRKKFLSFRFTYAWAGAVVPESHYKMDKSNVVTDGPTKQVIELRARD